MAPDDSSVMARYDLGIEPLASMPPRAVAAAIAPALEGYFVAPLNPDDQAGNWTLTKP